MSILTEDGRRRIADASARRLQDPAYSAKLLAARAEAWERQHGWSDEVNALVKGWLEAGDSFRSIGKRVGVDPSTVRTRALKYGWSIEAQLVKPAPTPESACYLVPEAASEVLRQHYPTDIDGDELLRLYIEARGEVVTMRAMWNHAKRLGVKRPESVYGFQSVSAAGTRRQVEVAQASREALAGSIQALLDEGWAQKDIQQELGVSKSKMQRIKAEGLITIPPREVRGRMPRLHKKRIRPKKERVPKVRVEKPRAPAKYAAPQANDARRVKVLLGRRVAFDEDMGAAIEEWIAANGVKRCPAAASAATTASISDADSAALGRYHQMIEATKGDPKQRLKAKMWSGF